MKLQELLIENLKKYVAVVREIIGMLIKYSIEGLLRIVLCVCYKILREVKNWSKYS